MYFNLYSATTKYKTMIKDKRIRYHYYQPRLIINDSIVSKHSIISYQENAL